jgi:hypothetical protein
MAEHASRLPAALLAVALLVSTAAAAEPLAWTAAAAHVGRRVTIEGTVARAHTADTGRCVLEFDAVDPQALRVVVLIPLVSDLPREPHRLFEGKRVQVTGRATRFAGRLEMVVTPAQIEVVGLTTSRPATPAAPPDAPRAAPTPPLPNAAAPPPPADRVCRDLAEQRAAVRAELLALVRELTQCLDDDRRGCAAAGDRLGPALSRLDGVEQRLERRCP